MIELNIGNDNKEYKIEKIWDNTVYTRESVSYLLELYYLVFLKKYLEEKST